MAFGDGALARVGADHRCGHQLRQGGQLIAGFGVMHALAGPEQGVLGLEQHARGLLDGFGIGRGALHRHRGVVDLALELGFEDPVGHLQQDRPALAGAQRLKGTAHQGRQLLHVRRHGRPLGDRRIDLGGAEGRADMLARRVEAGRDDQQRHVFRIGLGDAGEGVFDAGPVLGSEDAVLLAAADARIAVGHADADALLAAEDRPDVDLRAGVDQRVAGITGEEIGALALDDFSNDVGALHGELSPR